LRLLGLLRPGRRGENSEKLKPGPTREQTAHKVQTDYSGSRPSRSLPGGVLRSHPARALLAHGSASLL